MMKNVPPLPPSLTLKRQNSSPVKMKNTRKITGTEKPMMNKENSLKWTSFQSKPP